MFTDVILTENNSFQLQLQALNHEYEHVWVTSTFQSDFTVPLVSLSVIQRFKISGNEVLDKYVSDNCKPNSTKSW